MDSGPGAICTIATSSHLNQAACMLDSYLQRHPGSRGYVLHVDDHTPAPVLDSLGITRLALPDLRLPDLNAMRARYTAFELCNALKPFLLSHLLQTTGHDHVCYADGDLYFFDSVQVDVWNRLQTSAILLTPHLCRLPAGDPDLIWRDLAVLQHGVYNGGFIALRRSADAGDFLHWWGERTRRLGQKKLEEGLNCDQRWLDLLPGFDLDLHISRHPGLNAAYWNLHERSFAQQESGFTANGQPLLFFHFSGYSPDQPAAITRHFTRFNFDNRPDLRPIFDVYRAALAKTTAVAPPLAHSPVPDASVLSDRGRPAAAEVPDAPSPHESALPVSVIIPAFNAARYLATAIDSVLEQTLAGVEIIVVDDGSSDGTAAVAASYGNRVRLLRQNHAGVSAARNLGIQAANGQYIAFLDADDWCVRPDKLEKQAAILAARADVAIVHSGWRLVDDSGAACVERKPWQHSPILDLQAWLLWQPALPSAMMVRRQAALDLGGFDPALAHAEDLDLALRLTMAGGATAWLEEVTVAYRQHEENATRRLAASEADFDRVIGRFFARADLPSHIRKLAPRVRFGMRLWLAVQYYRAQAYGDMERVLRSTLPDTPEPSPAATVLAWLDGFESTLAGEYGERLDAYALTSRPEWQALVADHVIGQRPGQAIETGARFARANLSRLAPVGHARRQGSAVSVVSPVTAGPMAAPPRLDLSAALARDYGRHRSGWSYALRSLTPLHQDGGVRVDAFPEHTFGDAEPATLRAHEHAWIGFLHNPPQMPAWFVYNQSPQSLLANEAFRRSLPTCSGLFCMSEYLAQWWRQRVDVPIEVLRHPTAEPIHYFSMDEFVANPTKRIIQVGAWLRRLNSIFLLPVRRLQRSIVHQHRPYIDDLMAKEREVHGLVVDESNVETLPYLDDERYDDLLSRNLVFMELYDSSANNVIVECLVRATPVLVNPLPAIVEYLGRDYPFYFTNRRQAALKAEDMLLIEAAHRFLVGHPLRSQLSGESFAAAVAGSAIYRDMTAA